MTEESLSVSEMRFRLSSISTEQFATFDDVFTSDESQVGVKSKYVFRVYQNNNLIQVFFEIELVNKFKDNSPFIKLTVMCEFDIKKEDFKNICTDKEITLPFQLLVNIVGIAIGVARGVLHEKTLNTKFNIYPLPLIDVSDRIKGDLTVPINKLEQ